MDDTIRSQFRIPAPLYELLKESALAAKRSVNAELVYRLEQSFDSPVTLRSATDGAIVRELVNRFGGEVKLTLATPDDVKAEPE